MCDTLLHLRARLAVSIGDSSQPTTRSLPLGLGSLSNPRLAGRRRSARIETIRVRAAKTDSHAPAFIQPPLALDVKLFLLRALGFESLPP